MKGYGVHKLLLVLVLFTIYFAIAKADILEELDCENEYCDAVAEKVEFKHEGLGQQISKY